MTRMRLVTPSRLLQMRTKKGWSLDTLSRRLGEQGVSVTGPTLRSWETGKTQPRVDQYLALLEALQSK